MVLVPDGARECAEEEGDGTLILCAIYDIIGPSSVLLPCVRRIPPFSLLSTSFAFLRRFSPLFARARARVCSAANIYTATK